MMRKKRPARCVMRCSAFHGQCESLFLAVKRWPSDVHEAGFEVASIASSVAEEFKQEAVRMLVDGQSATTVAERLELSGTNLLYQWKQALIGRGGAAAEGSEVRVRQLEDELRHVEGERDISKKSVGNFRPQRVAECVCGDRADHRE